MSSNSTSPRARPISLPCGLSGTVDWESRTRKKSARTGIWKKMRLAVGLGRQVLVGEDLVGRRRRRQAEGVGHQLDRPRETLRIDVAHAVGLDVWRQDVGLQRDLQPLGLQRLVDQRIAFLGGGDAELVVGDDVLPALDGGGDEALHGLLVLGHLRRDDDAVAIDIHAEVDVAHGHDVVELDAARLEIEHRGEVVARDEVDRALHQALFAQLRGQVDVFPLGDAVHLGEGREQPERGVEHRGAQLLALEVLRPLDAALLQGVDAERREIVGHEDAEDFLARILGVVLDRRVHVGEADLVGAGGDPLDRAGRALAGIHRDVEAFGLVVALLQRHQEWRGRTLEHPVEGEFDRCLRLRGQADQRQRDDGRAAQPFGEFAHLLLSLVSSPFATLRRMTHLRQGDIRQILCQPAAWRRGGRRHGRGPPAPGRRPARRSGRARTPRPGRRRGWSTADGRSRRWCGPASVS